MFIYYVYAYLRKDGSPYYIGKGKENRYLAKHSVRIPSDRSRIIFLETKISEVGAIALERRYIKWYGRKDNHTGILRNLTDGGEGVSGRVIKQKTKEKLSMTSKLVMAKMSSLGKHPFSVRENGTSVATDLAERRVLYFQVNPEKARDLCIQNNKKRLSDGTHNWLDRDAASARNKRRLDNGSHNFLGKNIVTLVDKNGKGHRLPIDILNYWKSTGKPMTEWDYVAARSKEAKRRITSRNQA